MPVLTTACPRNCYSTCTIRAEVEDGRLRRVLPHEGNRATPEGPCLKGLAYVERVASPNRILRPLRKQRSGEFQPVSWESAIDEIGERLVRLRDQHGARALLYYCGSGTKGLLNGVGPAFWRLYGGYTTTYGDLCWPAGLEATRLTLGDNKHSAPWDLAEAKLIVMWGKNAAETNIHQMPFVEEAIGRGGRLVVIDPRRTQSSERAELLVQPRPGTDGALALAIAHVLFRDGLTDRAFLAAHVHGHDRFAEHVKPLTPEWAENIADVPAKYIERLAQMIGTVGPVSLCAGYGMQRYTNSGQTMRAMIALLALTGNFGRPGAGWIFANLQSAIFDEVKDPLAFYPPEQQDGVARISISTSLLGRGMLETKDPPLKMAWVERGNPITQNPETHTVLEAFRSLDFRVVVDQFLTDTAREADLVLPSKTMFEQSDVIGAYWHPYIQLKQKALDPPGEVKPESEIYRLLAQRLRLDPKAIDRELPGVGDQAVDRWLEQRLSRFAGLTLEGLRQGPILAPGHQEVAFSDFVFSTPSKKIEIWSDEAKRCWEVHELPDWFPAIESPNGKEPAASKYPLCFLTPNTKDRIHSQFNNLEMIQARSTHPVLHLSPQDAVDRGIRDGQRVRVFNDRGELELEARIDFGLRAGCVSVTNGWWIGEGGTVNYLSKGRETDMGHGAAFHDNRVEVEPLA